MTNVGSPSSPELEVRICFDPGTAVMAIIGDVDLVTERRLEAAMRAVTAVPKQLVVLDLSEVGFISPEGVRIVAAASQTLAAQGGRMRLRSPPRLVLRLMEILALDPTFEIEPRPPTEAAGPELTGHLGDLGQQTVGSGLRQISSIPADTDVVERALQLVTALVQATLAGADGVSVSLSRHGRLLTAAASDESISAMDHDQYASGEGPCVDASSTGRVVHAESLSEENRWPAFTPKATAHGIGTILSTPLLTSRGPAGALNLYSNSVRAFDTNDQERAAMFAERTSAMLDDAGATISYQDVAQRIETALRARELIAQAQGVVMERENLTADEAYASLRRIAVNREQALAHLASEVIASTQVGRRPDTGRHPHV